uniref:SPX domain-containing protein n=1 Tax=Salix viminalis TaxID=40686 RepID=A0A6N2LBZ0_SALVM
MKFGKEFKTHLEETLPGWRDKFLCYKPLKKLLKQLPPTVDYLNLDRPINFQHHQHPPPLTGDDLDNTDRPLVDLQEWFVKILNEELDKFNDFYVDKEEDFVICLQELKERIESLKEKSSKDGVFTSESEFSEEMMDIRKDLVTIHGEMVLLKNYSSLNFAGLVKILKKYDKRTGGLLRLPFTQLALHQPFFTTEPLTRLVHECEDNLELLFPLEAEVIESTNLAQDQSNPSLNNTKKISPEPSTTLGEETIDIYRSTLAAMKAIRGLQKASSTSNPLSFSSFFKIQDDESTGAVTAANSTSNSSASMHDGEEIDQEDLHSV